jgi:hypothetical protein
LCLLVVSLSGECSFFGAIICTTWIFHSSLPLREERILAALSLLPFDHCAFFPLQGKRDYILPLQEKKWNC